LRIGNSGKNDRHYFASFLHPPLVKRALFADPRAMLPHLSLTHERGVFVSLI
jgi:hypothetical protein